jgi:cytochrome P450
MTQTRNDLGRPLPTGFELTARDPVFRENPHGYLDALRMSDPVHQDRELGRFVLTRAGDIAAVLADRSMSSDPFKANPDAFGRRGFSEADRGALSMLLKDDPDHARLRGLVVKAFSARAVETLRGRIETVAAKLLDAIDPSEPFDLTMAYSIPLPILVIANMLGVAEDRVSDFKRWSDDFAILFNSNNSSKAEEERRRLLASRDQFDEFLREAVEERRRHPREDLISELVRAEQQGDKLTEAEIISTCRILLAAGNLTTTELIGNGTVALLRHPAQLMRLRSEPTLWPAAVEEVLRYDSPVTAISRQVTEPRHIGGCPIGVGQTVTTMLTAANHDPALHPDPHGFDIERQRQEHYSFGRGSHFCLGAALARLEGHVGLSALFARFPQLRLVPDRPLIRKAVPGLNGHEAIWLDAGTA